MKLIEEVAKTSRNWTYRQLKLLVTKEKGNKEKCISNKIKVEQINMFEMRGK